jgi:tight adherence protein B
MDWLMYASIFGAVVLLSFTCVRVGQSVASESIELKKKKSDVTMIFLSPLDRFVLPQRLLQLRYSLAVAFGTVIAGLLVFCGITNFIALVLLAAGLGWLGFMLPLFFYQNKVRKRKAQFDANILDLTIGLEKGLRSGQALAQAIESLVRRSEGPMQEELTVVLRETRMGKDLVEAMERLQVRMPSEDLMLLVTAIRLTMKSGGSMASVLARMTEMIRGRLEFKGKLDTLTAQGKFEAIAISCTPFAAFVVLYLLNPELMHPMLVCPVGWLAFGAVIALETVGFLIVRKIVTIEV